MNNGQSILEMLHIAEKLKMELRHSWLSNGRQESSAEHSWRLSLMVLLIAPETGLNMDLHKTLKMALVHDLVEAEAYDIPAFEKGREEEKKQVELAAANKYRELLNSPVGDEIFSLWQEYEKRETVEAKFVKAMDSLEVRIQHNEANISTWNDIEFPRSLFAADKSVSIDKFLTEFNELIKNESISKIKKGAKNIKEIINQAELLKKSNI